MKFSLSTVSAFKNIKSGDCIELTEEQLIQLQQTLYSILKDIVDFCDEHKINYGLGGGSALGAVRHHGIIPWDDDIDINMPRRDYNKFTKLFPREMGDKYWVHTPEKTDNLALLFSRVRLKGTSVKTREDYHTDECGAFIDIFIIENTFNNSVLRGIHGFGSLALGLLLSCRKFYRDRKENLKLAKENKSVRTTFRIKIAIGFCLSFLSINFWTRLANNWNALCHNNRSKYVTVPCGRKHFWGEMYLRNELCITVKMDFGDMKVRVPRAYDKYLTRLYGDYRKLPEETEQEKHLFYKPFEI